MAKAFNPLEREGFVWIRANILLTGLILMGDTKASLSSLQRLADAEGWESQKVGREAYYCVDDEHLKTRWGLEKLTDADFNADGDLIRLAAKAIKVDNDDEHLNVIWQSEVAKWQSTAEQYMKECSSYDHQLKTLEAENREKQSKIDTLNRKLAEAQKELLLTEHWKHTATIMTEAAQSLRNVIQRMPGHEVWEGLTGMVAKQGETLERLLTASLQAPVLGDSQPVEGNAPVAVDAGQYLAQLDAAIVRAKERVQPRPMRLRGRRLRFGQRVNDGAKLVLDPLDYADRGERDAILASSGMGKSYLTGVLMEETLEAGQLLLVMDPEGEHYTLAELYPVLVVGGEHADVPLPDAGTAAQLVEALYTRNISLVVDLSDLLPSEKQTMFALVGRQVMQVSQKYRQYLRFVVDECHLFAPQSGGVSKGEDTCLAVSQDVASRGRKRAVHSLWATQRPAKVHKDVLSQCNRFWIGGIRLEHDFAGVKDFVSEMGVTHDQLKALKSGEFYLGDLGEVALVKSRKRYCTHGGATPGKPVEVVKPEDVQVIQAKPSWGKAALYVVGRVAQGMKGML